MQSLFAEITLTTPPDDLFNQNPAFWFMETVGLKIHHLYGLLNAFCKEDIYC